MKFPRKLRPLVLPTLALAVLGGAFVGYANYAILQRQKGRVFSNVATVPAREVALVLGANPLTSGGQPNLHFAYRIEAAAALFHAGKVRHLLVSGDNHHRDYDEPTAMKNALIARGVPAAAITCDYAGFRTLDSVVRAHKVFGLRSFTIVSQGYHTARALEIARVHDLDAIAFRSRDVPNAFSLRTRVREVLARADTMLDLHVWHRGPRFPGPHEPIRLARK
ncbi:MAG: ElyC/SanA/YdcF family protein [Verrucomicrobiota bacterium]